MTAIRTAQARTLDPSAFDEFGGSFRGELLLPTSPGYDAARRLWNGAIDRHPACIARCTGVTDVVAAVRFARERTISRSPYVAGVITSRAPRRATTGSSSTSRRCGRCGSTRPPHGPGAGWCPVGRCRPRDAGPRAGHHRRHRRPYRCRRAHSGRRHRLPDAQARAHRRQPSGRGGGHRRGQHRPGGCRRAPRSVLGAARRRRQLRRRHLVHVRSAPRRPGRNGRADLWAADDTTDVLRFFREFAAEAPDDLGSVVRLGTVPPLPAIPEDLHWQPAIAIICCDAVPSKTASVQCRLSADSERRSSTCSHPRRTPPSRGASTTPSSTGGTTTGRRRTSPASPMTPSRSSPITPTPQAHRSHTRRCPHGRRRRPRTP